MCFFAFFVLWFSVWTITNRLVSTVYFNCDSILCFVSHVFYLIHNIRLQFTDDAARMCTDIPSTEVRAVLLFFCLKCTYFSDNVAYVVGVSLRKI